MSSILSNTAFIQATTREYIYCSGIYKNTATHCTSDFSYIVHSVYVIFGNVREGYERASSDNITAVMETCSQSDMDLSNLPQLFYSAQPFDIDWCKMIVSIFLDHVVIIKYVVSWYYTIIAQSVNILLLKLTLLLFHNTSIKTLVKILISDCPVRQNYLCYIVLLAPT